MGGSDSVEIISFGANFSPYKSQFEREFIEEMRHFEKHGKRKRALLNWKWDDVVDISSSDDESIFVMDNSRTSSATLSDSEIVMLASDSTQSNQVYADSLQCNVPRGRRPLRDRTLSVNNSSFNIQRPRKGVGLNLSARTIVGSDGTIMHNTIQSNADRATLIGSNTTPSHYTSQIIGVRSIERGSTGIHHSSSSNALRNNVSSSNYGNENKNHTGQRVLFWDCGKAEYVYVAYNQRRLLQNQDAVFFDEELHGFRADIVASAVNKSAAIWDASRVFCLTTNMRLHDPTPDGAEYPKMQRHL
ncbi:hypothetical protein L1987_31177 [Smallanthus sonchifolius]|uniref:Uncharacterized protein n=1 Tax=Smallanthus sonchifolius TaxID=185202 RepID=A0ACB9I4U2_9ASTR|nr:hypothetical protein L1987_31177 [Smallanthus sonchifolius]